MPVRLLRPYNDQAAGTLYWGADQAAVRATGGADDNIEMATDYQVSTRIVTSALATMSNNARTYRMNSASAQTLNLGAFVGWPNGTTVDVVQEGAGVTTVVPATGITVNTLLSSLTTQGQDTILRLMKTGDNSWIAFGVGSSSSSSSDSAQIAPYLGFATNRGMIPDSVAASGTPQQIMVRSLQYARCDLKAPRPIIPIGFYVTSANVETVQAGTYNVTASIEYPVGVFTQLKFGGLVTGTYAGGTYAIPDAPAIAIPCGATFFVKYWINSPNGYVYKNNYAGIAGDAANVAATTTDLTMSAMAGSTPGAVGHGPIGVIDTITQRSFFYVGDSLCDGGGTDSRDISGDFGVLARLNGAVRGYCNAGRSSTSVEQYISGSNAAIRTALGNLYASDIGSNYFVNSALNTVAAATFGANLRTLRALFPTKRFYQTDGSPLTNGGGSAWALLDASDQVINPTASPLCDAYKVAIRAGLITSNTVPITGILGTYTASQYSLNAQKIEPGLTADGIHFGGDRGYVKVAERTQGRQQLLW